MQNTMNHSNSHFLTFRFENYAPLHLIWIKVKIFIHKIKMVSMYLLLLAKEMLVQRPDMRKKNWIFSLRKDPKHNMDLHKTMIKGTLFCPELMKKMIFKVNGNFPGKAIIQTSSKSAHSANIKRFVFSNLLHPFVNWNVVRKLFKKFYGQKLWFYHFSSKKWVWLPSNVEMLQK